MKHSYFLLTSCLILSAWSSTAQTSATFEKDYEPIRSELTSWDPVRGAWLASSLPAVINKEQVQDRTFPDNLTPNQVLALVPKPTLKRIETSIATHQSDPVDGAFWTQMGSIVSNVGCVPVRGRSYGDPHLKSFDGERFSFQTVGEFVLSKSDDDVVHIQSRQKAVQDDFSLNTAVAMDVNGDRVCLYAEDHPDGITNTPLRVNGQTVHIGAKPYFLSNGGVITKSAGTYMVDWPTGESMTASPGRTGGVSFYNISVSINTCTRSYSGILGNANGSQRDDFDAPGVSAPITFFPSGRDVSRDVEKQRLAFLAKDFAEFHRINQATSLFDYGPGQSTFTFTDRSFPRVHRSIHDLNDDQRALARRNCQNRGVGQADMEGCIYDNAYLNIEPIPEPPIRTPVEPADIVPVRTPAPNTNPEPPVVTPTVRPGRTVVDPIDPSSTGGTDVRGDNNGGKNVETDFQNTNTPQPRPSTPTPTTRPSTPKPTPSTRPSTRPVFKPTPRPSSPRPSTRPSTPKPKPKPKPRPAPSRPSGRG